MGLSALSFSRVFAPAALPVAMLLALFLVTPALADESPFDLEPSSWMSFNRYKEKPSSWMAPDVRAQVAAQPVVVPPPTLPASLPPL